MSGELGQVGSLQSALERLWAIEAGVHESLSVYQWWRPDMQLPALWNWLTPGTVRGDDDAPVSRVVDVVRITVSIGVDPAAVIGEGDMLELGAYWDLARPILDNEIYGRHPFGQRLARRRGMQTVADELAGTSILTMEIPIEIELHNTVTPNP